MRSISLALALFALNCGTTPCRDRNIAFIAAGGPLGILAAALDQCTDDSTPPQQPQPIAAVPSAGLVEQTEQPDLGSVPPDMAEPSPDLSPLSCGPLFVVSIDSHGAEFCDRDTDGDAVADRLDTCPKLSAGQTPDPARRGCPAPRIYQIILPPAAFAAAGNVDLHDGTATSRPGYDWAALRHSPATLSSVIFFQNGGPNASNAVTFELVGVADFTAPVTTLDPCYAFKDNLHQDAVTRAPNDIACVARRLDLCVVDLVSPSSKIFGEEACARAVGGGSGYSSKANAPVKLTASVSSADFNSSEPQPVASVEVQVLFSGNVKLSGWEVVATIMETLH